MNVKNMPRIVLASASPRRIELMRAWGFSFEVRPSNISEETILRRPSAVVKDLAARKAAAVVPAVTNGIVLGADTIVVLNGEQIGKPKDPADAARILRALSGSYHAVYTGIALIDAATGVRIVDYDVARVRMRRFDPQELSALAGKHLDKAGAYAVQETEDAFVDHIDGDYFTVVGLPREKLFASLERLASAIRGHAV